MNHLFAKTALALSLSFLTPALGLAGDWKYSCESSDGTVRLTRDKISIATTDETTKVKDFEVYQSQDVNASLGDQQTINYIADGKWAGLTPTNVSAPKAVASEHSECEANDGTHGPGFESTSFTLEASLKTSAGEKKNLTFSCVEMFSWGGNCKFE